MIRPDKSIKQVYLYCEFVDMRRQINGLSILVEQAMHLNPLDGSTFVFCNKNRDKLKILIWEKNGFILFYKRLEKQKFKWPKNPTTDHLCLNGEELNWLIDGFDLWTNQAHKTLYFEGVS